MSQEEVERVYTIPLGKVLLSPNNQRAKRAVNMIREFARHHMKTEQIKIDQEVSHQVWARGIRHPPRKIRVKMTKDEDGRIIVSTYVEEEKAKVEEKPKVTPKKEEVKEKPEKPEEKEPVEKEEAKEIAKPETVQKPEKPEKKKPQKKDEAKPKPMKTKPKEKAAQKEKPTQKPAKKKATKADSKKNSKDDTKKTES